MKTRIISASIGIAILIFILYFYDTIVLNLATTLVCCIMVYEIFNATGVLKKSLFLFLVCEFCTMLLFFLKTKRIKNLTWFYLIGYGSIFLFIMFKNYSTLKIENLVFTFSFSTFITFALSIILEIRKKFYPNGLYYTILLFLIAWICDTGAYFIGSKFGRRKLAPNISPKKTIEGAIGGIILSLLAVTIFNLIVFFIFRLFNNINLLSLFIISFLGSICAIIGDLSMSIVKRNYEIKDFGNIMKGHGGLLDRFDSWIFVSIVTYPIILYYPILV